MAAGGVSQLRQYNTEAISVLISRMKGHEDDGMFFGSCEALPGSSPGAFVANLRKEVIQPQVPLRLPCYDFTPVADPTVVSCLLSYRGNYAAKSYEDTRSSTTLMGGTLTWC